MQKLKKPKCYRDQKIWKERKLRNGNQKIINNQKIIKNINLWGKSIEIILIVDVNKGHKQLFKHVHRKLLDEKKKIRDKCGAE